MEVAAARRRLEATREIPKLKKLRGKDGKSRDVINLCRASFAVASIIAPPDQYWVLESTLFDVGFQRLEFVRGKVGERLILRFVILGQLGTSILVVRLVPVTVCRLTQQETSQRTA